ncbi:MAG: DUF5702 domain-containing protein [Lachnospiraceae bacterium]
MMRLKGQVTVFISLIMMCVFALLCCLVESARTEGARWFLQMAASSSMDSVFSRYHRPLWDHYRLLFAEYDKPEGIASDFQTYLTPYLETDNWYPITITGAETEAVIRATDDHGRYLEQEILDYMRYGIWNLDFDGESVQGLWDSITEAKAVKDITANYRSHANEAMRLERALEAVSESLANQETWRSRGLSALQRYDGPAFRDAARRLIRELERMPGLVAEYRRQADALARGLEESRRGFAGQTDELSEQMLDLLEQEIRQYESYTAQDGEHRLEIEQKETLAVSQIPVVEALIEEALEVERIIDEWEDDDEDDDGPDLAALWRPVRQKFEQISIVPISFSHGIADKEKEGWLKSVEAMCGQGLLELVIPDGKEVSAAVLDLIEAPSRTSQWTEGMQDTSLVEQVLVNEYCGMFFPTFLSDKGNYEMEYLIAGQESDRANLEQVVMRLLAVREGLNLIHILSNPAKREQARNLAMVITGVGAATPIVFVMTFFIICVWALGESVMDIRGLLEGRNVVLLKTDETWMLSLEHLLAMGSSRETGSGGSDSGFGYLSWLKFLLVIEEPVCRDFRMMDLIQMNLKRDQENFRMHKCVYQVRIKTKLCGKHVFFALGFVEKMTGRGDHNYPMEIVTERTY